MSKTINPGRTDPESVRLRQQAASASTLPAPAVSVPPPPVEVEVEPFEQTTDEEDEEEGPRYRRCMHCGQQRLASDFWSATMCYTCRAR